METSHGYTAGTIRSALEITKAEPPKGKRLPSEQKIRDYAKQNNMYSFLYGSGRHKFFLVHESRIEELVQGMGISVDTESLYRSLEQINKELYGRE